MSEVGQSLLLQTIATALMTALQIPFMSDLLPQQRKSPSLSSPPKGNFW